MAETTAVVLGVLICFGIAIAVRLVMNRITLPYTVVLEVETTVGLAGL